MQDGGPQEHGVNDAGNDLPPQVQWQNDQVQNDGPVIQNNAQEVNHINNGAQEMQVQNEFNQNPNGGFQGGNDRNNFNQWQGAGGNAHNGWPNGGVVGYDNQNAAGAPYQGGGYNLAQYGNHGGVNHGNNAFQQLNQVPGQAIHGGNHGGTGQFQNPA